MSGTMDLFGGPDEPVVIRAAVPQQLGLMLGDPRLAATSAALAAQEVHRLWAGRLGDG